MEPDHQKPAVHVKKETAMAGVALLITFSAAGAALIVWWAVSFHRSNDQLWMVPIGLVMLGTPIIAWLSILASDTCRRTDLLLTAADASPTAPRPFDLER